MTLPRSITEYKDIQGTGIAQNVVGLVSLHTVGGLALCICPTPNVFLSVACMGSRVTCAMWDKRRVLMVVLRATILESIEDMTLSNGSLFMCTVCGRGQRVRYCEELSPSVYHLSCV